MVMGTCTVNSTVLRSEIHTSGSRSTRPKFSSPTNGFADSPKLQRCTDRYSANRIGANENTARCAAAGARNPHAVSVSRSRSGRARDRSSQRRSAATAGESPASARHSHSQPPVVVSPGSVRSASHRPHPTRIATTASGSPANRTRRTRTAALSPPGRRSAPSPPARAMGRRVVASCARSVVGSRAVASCTNRRVCSSHWSVLSRATARTLAYAATPTSSATAP